MKIKLYALISIIILTLPIFSVSPTQGTKLDNNSITNEVFEKTTIKGDGITVHWALLVAVGVYAEDPWQNRLNVLTEVEDLRNTLLESPCWSEDHIKVIKGEDATLSNIIAGLRWLDKMEDKDDISIVYISTHGGSLNFDIPPRDEADGRDEVLSTYWSFVFPSLSLLDDHLNFFLNRLESKGTCLIVDSCHAGGFNDSPDSMKLSKKILGRDNTFSASRWMEDFGREVAGKGRVVLMGSREDETAIAGMFSPYLIDGLKGFADFNHDNVVTAEEAYNYTKLRVPKYLHNPTIYDGYDGELPLVEISGNQINNDERSLDNNIEDRILPASISIENSIVCGYITDAETNEPIANANIYLLWTDGHMNYSSNTTTSDDLGFYSIDVSAGKIMLTIFTGGYCAQNIDYFNISENEIFWINASLIPLTENSIVCGYIRDNFTNESIENANITLQWVDGQGNFSVNQTRSDSLGYYSMNVAAGNILLFFSKEGYYSKGGYYNIDENETKWVNISMTVEPDENSVICGYVKDNETGAPIEDVDVRLKWNNYGQTHYNYTLTDSSGFYSMNVAVGSINLSFEADGYFDHVIDWFDIGENEVLWTNVSLINISSCWDFTVCGYIKDNVTNEPVENAAVRIDWRGDDGQLYTNETSSDDIGFYSICVKQGHIDYIDVRANKYLWYHSDDYILIDGEKTIWVNISLMPTPPETVQVYGYITDSETNKPIENANILIELYNLTAEEGLETVYDNTTKSDVNGFYIINVAAGFVTVYSSAEGYFSTTGSHIYEVAENEKLQVDISLDPCPPENAVVCGYITDAVTKEPIKNEVTLVWRDFDDDNEDYNDTITDSNGFYSVNAAEGKIYIYVDESGYLTEYSELTNIYPGETLWINLSMYSYPPTNSVVCGYITNADTHEPLANASVDLEWIGCEWHHISGSTHTDEYGYYSANVSAGEIYLTFDAEDYNYQKIGRQDVEENGTLWCNISLNKTKIIEVEIVKPLKAIYKNDKTTLPFKKSLIIGDVTIEADVYYCPRENLDRVEFYIDGKLKANVTSITSWYEWYYSYTWTRDKISIFRHKHTIKVVAYDNDGNSASDEITVWKFR